MATDLNRPGKVVFVSSASIEDGLGADVDEE
jgi:hypothetical protein